jgi:TolA-binding protein
MSLEKPPRLRAGELGPILRAADEADMSPERLAENGKRVKALIAAGTTSALWKLLGGLLLLGALAVPLAWQLGRSDEAPPSQPPAVAAPAPVAQPPDAAPIAVIEPDALPEPVPEPPPPAPEPVRHHRAAPPDAAEVVPPPPDAPPSDLPAQLALYDEARAAAASGSYQTALDRIDELFQRFPATQLRADAELTRADMLARAGRLADAARAFEALAADTAHRGRRGELLRTLGDLYRQLRDCARAKDAYTRALAERLSEKDRADAERGRDRCTPGEK